MIAGGTQTTSTVQNVVGSFSINGTRANQHEYTVDGVTNLNLGNNTGALVTLNPDAVEEVKVLTSNYQAEYGRAGGGYIALTTRGGTNEYRGGLRYFKRSESFNANNYFNNLNNRPKPYYRYDYAGWDFGGPIPLGGTSGGRRVFFFAAQEYYKQKTPATSPTNIRVPTAAERTGDFSQTRDVNGNLIVIRDPGNGQPFAGNVIPGSRFAPGMQALMNIYPQPNAPEGGNLYNYTSQLPRDIPRREDILRVDWQIASNTRLTGSYIHNADEDVQPLGTTTAAFNFPLADVVREERTRRSRLGDPQPHIQFDAGQRVPLRRGAGRRLHRSRRSRVCHARPVNVTTPLLFPGADPSNTLPSVSFGGISGQTFANTNFNGTPFDQKFIIHTVSNSLTKIKAAHTLKGGVYFQGATNRRTSFGPVQSNLAFGTSHPQNTGHPMANALLGLFDSYTQAEQKITSNYYYRDLSAYVQDTWKIKPTVTLDLGLARLATISRSTTKKNGSGSSIPSSTTPSQAVRLYRPVCVGSPCVGARARSAHDRRARPLDNTRPTQLRRHCRARLWQCDERHRTGRRGLSGRRLRHRRAVVGTAGGLSWDVGGDAKTVVRGGFGISYDRIDTDRIADAITNPPGIQVATLSQRQPRIALGRSAQRSAPRLRRRCGDACRGESADRLQLQRSACSAISGWSHGARHGVRRHAVAQQPAANRFRMPSPMGRCSFRKIRIRRGSAVTVPAVEPNLPKAYIDAGLRSRGECREPEPASSLSRIWQYAVAHVRQQRRIQLDAGFPESPVLARVSVRRLLYAVASHDRFGGHDGQHASRSTSINTTTHSRISIARITSSPITSGTSQRRRTSRRRSAGSRTAGRLGCLRRFMDFVGKSERAGRDRYGRECLPATGWAPIREARPGGCSRVSGSPGTR